MPITMTMGSIDYVDVGALLLVIGEPSNIMSSQQLTNVYHTVCWSHDLQPIGVLVCSMIT